MSDDDGVGMRSIAVVVALAVLGPIGGKATADTGPPFDYASGLADATTGALGAVMGRTGALGEHDLPSLQTGQTGRVGILRDAPATRVQAWAVVDTTKVAAVDPEAAVCIRITAPASEDAPQLPNTVEGGGPVCRFLDAEGSIEHRTASAITIQTFADLEVTRTVGVEVFASWRQPHPREDGATTAVARVHSIAFAAA